MKPGLDEGQSGWAFAFQDNLITGHAGVEGVSLKPMKVEALVPSFAACSEAFRVTELSMLSRCRAPCSQRRSSVSSKHFRIFCSARGLYIESERQLQISSDAGRTFASAHWDHGLHQGEVPEHHSWEMAPPPVQSSVAKRVQSPRQRPRVFCNLGFELRLKKTPSRRTKFFLERLPISSSQSSSREQTEPGKTSYGPKATSTHQATNHAKKTEDFPEGEQGE